MSSFAAFLKKQDIVFSPKRYFVDALGAMAQGLFASFLIGTILKTIGEQTSFELMIIIGAFATAVMGPAMAVAIGRALNAPPLVLFSMVAVGWAACEYGGTSGPLAVFFIALIATEFGKFVSKTVPIDIIVTPIVTIKRRAMYKSFNQIQHTQMKNKRT